MSDPETLKPSPNFLSAQYTIEQQGNLWFLVVEVGERKIAYPSASRAGAEVMMSLEKKRRGDIHHE